MSRNPIRPCGKRIMWLYGWEFFTVYRNPENYGDNRHFDMGDLIILICNVASFDYVFKSLLDDMGGSPSWLVTVESNLVVIGIVVV